MGSTATNISIQITAFGIAKDIIGARSTTLSIPKHTTVLQFRSLLERQFPELSTIKQYSIALGDTYATEEDIIRDVDRVTILPPVSGG